METNTISTKLSKKSLSKTNTDIINALKNITWTDEQVKQWKKSRKPLSTTSK
jgi:hypothetical protein